MRNALASAVRLFCSLRPPAAMASGGSSLALRLNFLVVAVSMAVWGSLYVSKYLREFDLAASHAAVCPRSDYSENGDVIPHISRPSEKYISLILPAYNEEARLRITLDEMLSYLQKRADDKSFTYEIIIVDDGSTDNTLEIASEYVKTYGMDMIRVLKQVTNQGKGAAVRKGMLCSRGELLLMLDSDGATRFADLRKLELQMLRSMADQHKFATEGSVFAGDSIPIAVWGSRAHLEKQALATRKWYRNILMKGFHLCVRLVAGGGIRDTQCGFKMFTRAAARKLFHNMRLRRWTFDVELLYLCKKLRIPVHEVAVTWSEIPGSKVKLLGIAYMLVELLLIRVGYGLHVWKIVNNSLRN